MEPLPALNMTDPGVLTLLGILVSAWLGPRAVKGLRVRYRDRIDAARREGALLDRYEKRIATLEARVTDQDEEIAALRFKDVDRAAEVAAHRSMFERILSELDAMAAWMAEGKNGSEVAFRVARTAKATREHFERWQRPGSA